MLSVTYVQRCVGVTLCSEPELHVDPICMQYSSIFVKSLQIAAKDYKKCLFAGEICLLLALHLADLQSLLHQVHDIALWRRTENKKKSEIGMEM